MDRNKNQTPTSLIPMLMFSKEYVTLTTKIYSPRWHRGNLMFFYASPSPSAINEMRLLPLSVQDFGPAGYTAHCLGV